MSEKRARYVGTSQTGVDLSIPVNEGEYIHLHVPHGGEVPHEVNGVKIPASYRDSLLEQTDNWTEVKRATGAEATGQTTTKATSADKDGEK